MLITTIQKDQIIKDLVEWIKTEYPNRTSQYEKCSRDLSYIITAIVNDIEFNSGIQTQNIANKFWTRGESNLTSLNVELEVYEKLKNYLMEYILDRDKQHRLHDLFFILSTTIKTGPQYIDKSWEQMCNNRIMSFNWTDQVPHIDLINNILRDVHDFCPSKQRRVRYNIDVIPIYNNQDLKIQIYRGTKTDVSKPNSRYNPQVLAPWVLMFSVNKDKNIENRNEQYFEKEAWLDIGLALQQIMLSSVSKGLAVGLCGCINNYDEIESRLGRRPVIYAGIGYHNPSRTYFCPIRKKNTLVPLRHYDTKPLIDSYIYYHI